MKKVLLSNIPTTLNYGSAMMAINLINGLRRELGPSSIKIYCECDQYNLTRLKESTGDHGLKRFIRPADEPKSIINRLKLYVLGKGARVTSVSSFFDAMIVLGGDDFSEVYKKRVLYSASVFYHINRRCPVVLAGQSLGPFSGIYKLCLRFLLKKIIITTREDNCYEFVTQQLKLNRTLQSRDLALLPLHKQNIFKRIIRNNKLDTVKNIVLVPSGLSAKYTDDKDNYIVTWTTIILQLLTRFPDYKLVLLAHVLKPAHADDSLIIKAIISRISPDIRHRITTFTEPLKPAEARAILGNSYFVITGRMHAAVSTLFMGKPAISLAYSEKYYGVIGRGFNLNELIIDSRSRTWGQHSDIIADLSQRIDYVTSSYDNICNHIKLKSKECEQSAQDQLSFVASVINRTYFLQTSTAKNAQINPTKKCPLLDFYDNGFKN